MLDEFLQLRLGRGRLGVETYRERDVGGAHRPVCTCGRDGDEAAFPARSAVSASMRARNSAEASAVISTRDPTFMIRGPRPVLRRL
jgi:hypothetical protein